jgi:hypothetical protein
MKQGLLAISPETKDMSLDYTKILNSLASKRNKKQCLRLKLSLMFDGGIWLKYFQTLLPKKVYNYNQYITKEGIWSLFMTILTIFKRIQVM